jgi:hypothetical protein
MTAEEAVANFHEQYRLARAGICRSGGDEDEVVVCGERIEDSPYRIAASTRVAGYRPPPPGSSLFDVNLGPVRIGCCALATGHGSGAGLSITMGF